MNTTKGRRKLRREFGRRGYSAVYHEVNGYPPGKRELAHAWLRERERASDHRAQWIFALIAVGVTTAIVATYFASVELKWL